MQFSITITQKQSGAIGIAENGKKEIEVQNMDGLIGWLSKLAPGSANNIKFINFPPSLQEAMFKMDEVTLMSDGSFRKVA